ncbi:MAG: PilN domain-containing protein [Planctomycetota bacterium]|jgi:Tfp pilus assembly protein PilN
MSNNTFLPEDYLAKKAERRTNVICLILFLVVMLGVLGAFLFTNRRLVKIKDRQQAINVQYHQAALQIEELNELESQKQEMLDKAELAAALVEKVPRSILLAELINRMPPRLGLIDLQLTSERIKDKPKTPEKKTGDLPRRGRTKAEAAVEAKKIKVPRYHVTVALKGVAPTDLEVSQYKGELSRYQLLKDVTLDYTEEKDIEGRRMREFRITMTLDNEADIRSVDPLFVPRVRNPMVDTVMAPVVSDTEEN